MPTHILDTCSNLHLAQKVRPGLDFLLRVRGQKSSLCAGPIKSTTGGDLTLELLWGADWAGATPTSAERGCSQPWFSACRSMPLAQPSFVIFKFSFPDLRPPFSAVTIKGRLLQEQSGDGPGLLHQISTTIIVNHHHHYHYPLQWEWMAKVTLVLKEWIFASLKFLSNTNVKFKLKKTKKVTLSFTKSVSELKKINSQAFFFFFWNNLNGKLKIKCFWHNSNFDEWTADGCAIWMNSS